MKSKEEIMEVIKEKEILLKDFHSEGYYHNAELIATQLVWLCWTIDVDGSHYYRPYDDIPF